MTLALGLAATFIGAAFVISGYSNRPLGRLLFGYWDAPGTSTSAPAATAPGTALTGGVHAPGSVTDPVGAAHKGTQ